MRHLVKDNVHEVTKLRLTLVRTGFGKNVLSENNDFAGFA
jgi:hypothetical protein